MFEGGLFVIVLVSIFVLILLAKTAIVVPQQSAFVVERLGRFSGTLDAGFHILMPFIDVDPLPPLAEGDRRSTSRRRSASRATTCRSAWTACST